MLQGTILYIKRSTRMSWNRVTEFWRILEEER